MPYPQTELMQPRLESLRLIEATGRETLGVRFSARRESGRRGSNARTPNHARERIGR